MKRVVKHIIICILSFVVFIGNNNKAHSQDVDYKAYSVFLYNFMKYIEWPSNDGDFIIGVVGESRVKKELEELAKNKKIKGRKIVLISVVIPTDALLCNLVYLPTASSSSLKAIAEKIKNKSILIVAEREGLAKKGADISFLIDEDDALRFYFNKSVLDSHNLKIANILVGLGILVE
jgi:hypothetical protein